MSTKGKALATAAFLLALAPLAARATPGDDSNGGWMPSRSPRTKTANKHRLTPRCRPLATALTGVMLVPASSVGRLPFDWLISPAPLTGGSSLRLSIEGQCEF